MEQVSKEICVDIFLKLFVVSKNVFKTCTMYTVKVVRLKNTGLPTYLFTLP